MRNAGRRQALSRERAWRAAGVVLVLVLGLASRGGAEQALGQQIYRKGMLGPGQPLTGRVHGETLLTGAEAACANCHQRSGLGTTEGATAISAIAGPVLAHATATGPRKRPAYTDATLARAIREGVDAAGQPLHPLMPRYAMTDAEISALGAYLKTLSLGPSPGVSERTVRFATVITEEVSTARQQAMLGVLDACVTEADELVRAQAGERSHGPSRTGNAAARSWALDRWVLKGPRSGWPAQLDAYYRGQPVFAVLSGISAGDWRPVHEFCERHEVPCLLPNTPLPSLASDDFYTLYLNKGFALEAQVLAAHLSRTARHSKVLQVYRRDTAGETAAGALRRAFAGHESGAVVDWPLADHEVLNPQTLVARLAATQTTAAILWLPREAWATLGANRWSPAAAMTLYGSSTLLGGDLSAVPETLRRSSLVVHSLSPQRRIRRVESWLASRGLAPADQPVQAQTYFACLIAAEGLKRAGGLLHRDRFLEVIDRMGMAPMGSGFPRPDFAPGRRYLVNGAYIVEIGEGAGPSIRGAHWIVP